MWISLKKGVGGLDILFCEVQKCHLMQGLEYLNQILKFCEKYSTRRCGGCNPLNSIDCYGLKYAKN